MELFDSVTNILSLLFGGSLISIVTWRFARRKAAADAKKAEAEAKQAEAEAKKAEAEAMKEKQDYYQQLAKDLADDRDYYKQQRDEQREKLDKLTRSVVDWKTESDEKIRTLQMQVARNGRQMEAMRPFMCADMKCKKRQLVARLEDVEVKPVADDHATAAPADIEPIDQQEL